MASVEVFADIVQGTEEWHKLRLGIPTASNFGHILAKGEGKVRTTYLHKLAGERITGVPAENYTNPYMERGKALEDEARKYYALMTDTDPVQVGFVRNGGIGCSPDALVGDDGILEIKTISPHLLIPILKADKFPPEHRPQCQGGLLVTERQYVDLILYYPGFPAFIKREYRVDAYLAGLRQAIGEFQAELDALVAWLENYAPARPLGLRDALTGSLA